MIYHVMPQGIYTRQFCSFMRDNKRSIFGEHTFIFLRSFPDQLPDGNNYLAVNSFWSWSKFFFSLRITDRIIMHSYGDPWLYILCSIFRHRLRRFTWVIWGGDLYFYRIFKQSLKYRIYEMMRKYTIKRFGFVIASVNGDYQLATKVYGVDGEFIGVGYPIYGLAERISKEEECPQNVNFLLGNSADKSNNHIELLKMLACHKDQNIRVYIPLSYGGDPEYINNVIQIGKNIFSDKFLPLTEFMKYEDYCGFLRGIDVMFCLHDRQQAMGTLWIVLSAGGKVVLRKDVTTYNMFIESGLKVFSWDSINYNDFPSLIRMPLSDKQSNCEILNSSFSLSSFFERWNNAYILISQ
jgi:dTDP-N-acetylfucosamine:lipid II N-acetylfucosaminyltransferase